MMVGIAGVLIGYGITIFYLNGTKVERSNAINFLQTSSNIGDISKSKDINKELIDSKNLIIQYRN
jgi:hypothetical protein